MNYAMINSIDYETVFKYVLEPIFMYTCCNCMDHDHYNPCMHLTDYFFAMTSSVNKQNCIISFIRSTSHIIIKRHFEEYF